MSEPQFQLVDLTKEELQAFSDELQALVDKHSIHLDAKPAIENDGRLIAKMVALKKVELIPKENGTLVPKNADNGEKDSDKPEQSPEEQISEGK